MIIFYLILITSISVFRLYSQQIQTTVQSLTQRSGSWRTIRNKHIQKNPHCAICGSKQNLTVHHIKSFNENPELELVPENLITLCENKNLNCHFVFGHKMKWNNINRNIHQTIQFMKEFLKDN